MLGMIWRWWTARQILRRRALFRYFDGTRWRAIDPLPAWRRWLSDPEYDPEVMAERAMAGEDPEMTYALNAIARTLDAQRYDDATGHGMIDEELLSTLDQFIEFVEAVKKKRDSGLTWRESTDSESLPPLTPPESPTT